MGLATSPSIRIEGFAPLMERLPTFIIIGAMKAGTTSLAAYVGGHSEVFVTTPKEARFFGSGTDENWKKGLGWYEQLFAGAGNARARGEASPGYTTAPHVRDVPARMAAVVPSAKLIYLLRNPVDRIRSMYLDRYARGVESLPFDEAIETKARYLDPSRYAYQLELYLEHFPREQILVLSSDRLRHARHPVLREVFEFIDVDPDSPLTGIDRELNRSADKRVPRGIYHALSTPFRRTRAERFVPLRIKQRARRMLSRQAVPEELESSEDLEQRIWSRLAPDLARLRQIVGPEFDLWGRA